MNLALIIIAGFSVFLLVLLFSVLRDPRKLANPENGESMPEESEWRHVAYFPQVRQAMAAEDLTFIVARSSRGSARRVRNERRRVALVYLSCLRGDFMKLWRLARVIASLSPQVGMAQEFARLRLGVGFSLRYEMVRLKFTLGFSPLPELGVLSQAVSRLAIRLETAMKEIGESAALAAKLASAPDGRGLNSR